MGTYVESVRADMFTCVTFVRRVRTYSSRAYTLTFSCAHVHMCTRAHVLTCPHAHVSNCSRAYERPCQVAFSSRVSGVCGDDAQPYACATQRFSGDFLLPQVMPQPGCFKGP